MELEKKNHTHKDNFVQISLLCLQAQCDIFQKVPLKMGLYQTQAAREKISAHMQIRS